MEMAPKWSKNMEFFCQLFRINRRTKQIVVNLNQQPIWLVARFVSSRTIRLEKLFRRQPNSEAKKAFAKPKRTTKSVNGYRKINFTSNLFPHFATQIIKIKRFSSFKEVKRKAIYLFRDVFGAVREILLKYMQSRVSFFF